MENTNSAVTTNENNTADEASIEPGGKKRQKAAFPEYTQ